MIDVVVFRSRQRLAGFIRRGAILIYTLSAVNHLKNSLRLFAMQLFFKQLSPHASSIERSSE
jgi:hypothetical protein